MASNGRPPPPTDRVRELAAYIADEPDEITETHIHVHPPRGSVVEADATGRLRAVSAPDDEPTAPDHSAPRSGWPERVSRALVPLLGGLPPWGRVVVLLALIAVLALSVWRGGAGVGLWG